jgi:phenylacetate-CoA ligase
MVSPSILTHPFKPLDQIIKSQIVQSVRDRILVKIVPSDEFTQDHEDTLRRALIERLGDQMQIDVQVVDAIPPERSGKFRWVISTVPHDYRLSWDGPDE